MQRIERTSIAKVLLYIGLYFVGGLLREMPRMVMFLQPETIVYCALIISWMGTLKKRIPDTAVRNNLYGMCAGMLSFMILRSMKYMLFNESNTACIYTFYLYGMASLLIAEFSLLATIGIGRPSGKIMNRWGSIHIIGIVLVVIILTNNLHGLVYRFNDPINPDINDYSYGPLFYLYIAFREGLMILSFVIAIIKCRISACRRLAWAPAVVMALFYLLIVLRDQIPGVNIIPLFNYPELFCGMAAFFWESLIQIGFIRSCTSYEKIFDISSVAMSIIDDDQETIRESRVARDMRVTDDLVEYSRKIRGGRIHWFDDISGIHSLRKEIDSNIIRLKEEEELIKAEKALALEKSRIEYKNGIYDDISQAVGSYLELVKESLDKEDGLKKCAVYGAYIKRRANLMLLASQSEEVFAQELYLSIKDSMDYVGMTIEDSSVRSVADDDQDNTVSADKIIELFDLYEKEIENIMGRADKLTVNVITRGPIRVVMDSVIHGEARQYVIC